MPGLLKPSAIAQLDRGGVARTGTVWLSLLQEPGLIRDLANQLTTPDLAMSGTYGLSEEGTAISFNGTTDSTSATVTGLPTVNTQMAFIARVRYTGAQAGNPGAAFGAYAGAAQGGMGIGFNAGTVGMAWLSTNGAGVAAPVPVVQGRWYTVMVQGEPISTSPSAARCWVDGAPAVTGSAGSGTINAPINSVSMGGQFRTGSHIRWFRGDILWAALLVGETPNWVTDEFAASLYESDYPYNLIARPRSIWLPPVAAGIVGQLDRTLADVTLAATGGLMIGAQLTQTLAPMTLAAAGTLQAGNSGQLGATLEDMTLSAAATTAPGKTGQMAATLAPMTLQAAGSSGQSAAGQVDVLLEPMTLSSAGRLPAFAGLQTTLAPMTLSAAAASPIKGAAAIPLAPMLLTASGASTQLAGTGQLAALLGDMTLVASGRLFTGGSVDVLLQPMTLLAAGYAPGTGGRADIVLAPMTMAAAGVLPTTARLNIVLAPMTMAATGILPATASLAALLGDMTLVAVGHDSTVPETFTASATRRVTYSLAPRIVQGVFSQRRIEL